MKRSRRKDSNGNIIPPDKKATTKAASKVRKTPQPTVIFDQDRFNRAEAIASLGTWEMSGKKGDIFWSDEFYRLHGLKPQSVPPSTKLRLSMVHPDDRDKLKQAFASALKEGTPYQLEKRIVHPNGKILWVLSQGEVLYNRKTKTQSIFGVLIDITARKNAELERNKLQEGLRQSQKVASMGSWEKLGKVDIYWSDEFYRIHGLKPGSIKPTAKARMSMVHPEDRAKLERVIKLSAKEGGTYSVENRIIFKNKDIKWVLSQGEAIKDATGQVRIYGTIINITEEKEQISKILELQKSLAEFQRAVYTSAIVSRADVKGSITYVNENFVKISGYTSNELIGKDHRIINSGHHPKSFWIDMWKTIARGKTWRGEVKNKAKNGSFYWVDTFIMPFLDEKGRVIEFLSIRNDITQRKAHEENIIELNQSLADFQDAIQYSSIVSRADERGIITDVNKNFVKISGYSSEELVGQNHRIINSGYHDKAFWINMWKTIASGKMWRAEVKNKAKDGTFYWVDTFIMPFMNDKGRVKEFLSIRNDITSRKKSVKI